MSSHSNAPSDVRPPNCQRQVPRYSLIVGVDIIEPASDLRLSGRVSEISRKGCYVDILNTLPTGTVIRLHMTRDQGRFTTLGKVIYVQQGVGMGVAFQDTTADEMNILDAWLAELNK
ncbi:MAG: PilZ domain-containing protein [Candidatus Acidiferrales bacterium]